MKKIVIRVKSLYKLGNDKKEQDKFNKSIQKIHDSGGGHVKVLSEEKIMGGLVEGFEADII